MKVVYYPDPVLKKEAEPIEKIDSRVETLIDDMFETMFKYKGCGLAAPQVGISKRIQVYTHTGDPKDCNFLINPKIVEHEDEEIDTEGCLSFPDIVAPIKRWKYIKVETLTIDSNKQLETERLNQSKMKSPTLKFRRQ